MKFLWQQKLRMLAAAGLIAMASGLVSCEEEEEGMDAEYILSSVLYSQLLGEPYYTFTGTLNEDATSSCGTATEITTTDETTTSGASTLETTNPTYRIKMYYVFKTGIDQFQSSFPMGQAVLYTKWEYKTSSNSFSLTPTTQTTSTCPTIDFIKCNGTSGVNPTCETVDNINCGGTNAFSFTSTNDVNGAVYSSTYAPDITFQAESGTTDWSEAFALNSSKTEVTKAKIKFTMLSSDGSILEASVYCQNNVY